MEYQTAVTIFHQAVFCNDLLSSQPGTSKIYTILIPDAVSAAFFVALYLFLVDGQPTRNQLNAARGQL